MKITQVKFLKKSFFGPNVQFWPNCGPKLSTLTYVTIWKWHIHKSGSALRISVKKKYNKGAKRYMQIIWIIFLKKITFGPNGPFCAWKWWVLITLDPFLKFFNSPQWKGYKEVYESYMNGFNKKILVQHKWTILGL